MWVPDACACAICHNAGMGAHTYFTRHTVQCRPDYVYHSTQRTMSGVHLQSLHLLSLVPHICLLCWIVHSQHRQAVRRCMGGNSVLQMHFGAMACFNCYPWSWIYICNCSLMSRSGLFNLFNRSGQVGQGLHDLLRHHQ